MATGMLPHIARACRDCRERADATQLAIATSADVSHAAISRFENAKSWPLNADRIVEAYADECGMRPVDLWAIALEVWRS